MTSSEQLNPRWLTEQGKHTASFSQLASKHVVFWVLFLNSSSPLSKDHKCSASWAGGKRKRHFFSETWHSQLLASSFSSCWGYLTLSECSWAGEGRSVLSAHDTAPWENRRFLAGTSLPPPASSGLGIPLGQLFSSFVGSKFWQQQC